MEEGVGGRWVKDIFFFFFFLSFLGVGGLGVKERKFERNRGVFSSNIQKTKAIDGRSRELTILACLQKIRIISLAYLEFSKFFGRFANDVKVLWSNRSLPNFLTAIINSNN